MEGNIISKERIKFSGFYPERIRSSVNLFMGATELNKSVYEELTASGSPFWEEMESAVSWEVEGWEGLCSLSGGYYKVEIKLGSPSEPLFC